MSDTPDNLSRHQPERPRRAPRRQQISSLQIVFAAILSIGLLLVINFSGRIARGQLMEAQRHELEATITVLEAEKQTLLRERDYSADDAYVEYWAHTESKMVREGEVLVIPVPAGNAEPTAPPPTPIVVMPESAEPEIPRWHLWWNLFVDGKPPF